MQVNTDCLLGCLLGKDKVLCTIRLGVMRFVGLCVRAVILFAFTSASILYGDSKQSDRLPIDFEAENIVEIDYPESFGEEIIKTYTLSAHSNMKPMSLPDEVSVDINLLIIIGHSSQSQYHDSIHIKRQLVYAVRSETRKWIEIMVKVSPNSRLGVTDVSYMITEKEESMKK